MRFEFNITKRDIFLVVIVLSIFTISGVDAVVPSPGHSWSQMECDNNLCIISNKVGIGTITPSAKLHLVGGDFITNGKVGIGVAVPTAKLHVVDQSGILVGEPSSSGTISIKAGSGLAGAGGSIVSSGDIELSTGASSDIVLTNGNLLNYKEFRFDGSTGNLIGNGGLIVADSVQARNNIYSGGVNDGNKVCRKDGINCPPATNPQLSCTTRSGGRGSGPKSVSCQSGETMTGGGCQVFPIITQSALSQHSYPRLPDTWTCDYGGYESKPYAICCRITS